MKLARSVLRFFLLDFINNQIKKTRLQKLVQNSLNIQKVQNKLIGILFKKFIPCITVPQSYCFINSKSFNST